jgi:heme/copper-type cytochrome/quinol oxidase subunit 2
VKPFSFVLAAELSIFVAIVCLVTAFLVRGSFRFSHTPMLEIRAVAHDWWWEFDYPSLGIKTSNVLHLPSATSVRLPLVSANVIHSLWMSGMKEPVDIIPGGMRSLDLLVKSPGELYGNCDSGCGCGTVCMRFRVLAASPRDFAQWASRENLHHTEWRPPNKADAPVCALDSRHGGPGASRFSTNHLAANHPSARHLQRLLDGGDAAGNLASH